MLLFTASRDPRRSECYVFLEVLFCGCSDNFMRSKKDSRFRSVYIKAPVRGCHVLKYPHLLRGTGMNTDERLRCTHTRVRAHISTHTRTRITHTYTYSVRRCVQTYTSTWDAHTNVDSGQNAYKYIIIYKQDTAEDVEAEVKKAVEKAAVPSTKNPGMYM